MTELFKKCIEIILKNEGGYVNHPHDPGGETKYGIAKKFFPDEDIKNLTIDRAKELYYAKYWLPMNLWLIENENIVLQIFDFGINAGKSRAIKAAQSLAGVDEDGIVGHITANAINNYQGNFVIDYKHCRKVWYEYLADYKPGMKVFLKGWLNRIEKTHFK